MECCANGHNSLGSGIWLGREHFQEGGDRFGQLPPEDFDKKKVKRAKKVMLVEHLQVELRAEESCFFCKTPAFKEPRQANTVRNWLQKYRVSMYARLQERFRANDGTDMVKFPHAWPEILKEKHADFYAEINQELTFSTIEADHLVQAKYIELMSTEAYPELTEPMLEYGGRELGVPTCQKCNRGRHLAGQETPERIMQLWAEYKFDGNIAAAKADPRYRVIELLGMVAYAIELDLRRLRRHRASGEES